MFLGIDLGTQSIKLSVLDNNGHIFFEEETNFKKELQKDPFSRNGKKIRTNPLVWLESIDKIFKKVPKEILNKIKIISGSAQQHGSVFWKNGSLKKLNTLSKCESSLIEHFKNAFVVDSPIWMDHSTSKQVERLEKEIGGFMELYKRTGSKGYERFTGMQIAKIIEEDNQVLEETEKISLISSFTSSIFIGDYCSLELGDASGMNLLNLKTRKWDEKCMKILFKEKASAIKIKLGNPIPSDTICGNVCSYFVRKYHLNPNCKVLVFTGDNLSSSEYILREENDVGISLGTSHTIFTNLKQFEPENGNGNDHWFLSPKKNSYFRMICIRNGGLIRENIKKLHSITNWDEFNECLKKTEPANDDNIGFYFLYPEIIPKISKPRIIRFSKGKMVTSFSKDVDIRAVIEFQVLSLKHHSTQFKNIDRLILTGGASVNNEICKIFASVFNCKVYTMKNSSNSASVGGAIRCLKKANGTKFHLTNENLNLISVPNSDDVKKYEEMLIMFSKLEKIVINEQN